MGAEQEIFDMTKVINLRGANGSGKSFLIKRLLCHHNGVPQPQQKNLLGESTSIIRPQYYTLNDGGIVVGYYGTNCGGCDMIKSTEGVRQAVLSAISLKPRYVIFEGVIISTVFSSWLEFSKKVGGMYWVYLDTPIAICLKRIAERNQGKAIKFELVHDKIRSIESTRLKAEAAKEKVVQLHYAFAFDEFQELLKIL